MHKIFSYFIIIFSLLFFSLETHPIQAQELNNLIDNTNSNNTSTLDLGIWDQVPIVVVKKLNLSFLDGWGLKFLILYLFGVILSVYSIHRWQVSNNFAPEIIVLMHFLGFILLPYLLWLNIQGHLASRKKVNL